MGRITQQVLLGAREISYLYDRNGNLTSLTPPGKPTHSFGYTAVDLTERYRSPLLNGDSTVTRYLHDLDKRIRNTVRPDSIAISVFYDSLGCGSCGSASRPKTIIFDRGTLNFSYDPTTGLLDSLSAPGGNALTYNYDGTLPKKVTWSGEVQGNVEVTYDNNFRATFQKVNGGNDVSFQYDNDGLLTDAGDLTITRDPRNGRITGTTLGSVTTGRTYDNRLSLDAPAEMFAGTYDDQGRLLTYGNASYTYRRNGELLTKVVGTHTTRYTYDAFGNLVKVIMPNGDVIEYVIDGQNRRVGKKINGSLASSWLYQNQLNIIAEFDGIGNLVSRFVYGTQPRVPDFMIRAGATTFTTLETGTVALGVSALNYALVGAGYELGLGIGSLISAAIWPNAFPLDPCDDPCSRNK